MPEECRTQIPQEPELEVMVVTSDMVLGTTLKSSA